MAERLTFMESAALLLSPFRRLILGLPWGIVLAVHFVWGWPEWGWKFNLCAIGLGVAIGGIVLLAEMRLESHALERHGDGMDAV